MGRVKQLKEMFYVACIVFGSTFLLMCLDCEEVMKELLITGGGSMNQMK